MARLGCTASWREVEDRIVDHLCDVFEREPVAELTSRAAAGSGLLMPIGDSDSSTIKRFCPCSLFFIAPRVNAGRATTNVVPAKDTLANYRRSSAGAGIDLGYGVLSRTDEVRLGYEVRYDDTSVVIGNPNLPAFTGTSNIFSLRWYHDGQDSATVPRRGLQLNARGSWFLNSAASSQDFPAGGVLGLLIPPCRQERFSLCHSLFGDHVQP